MTSTSTGRKTGGPRAPRRSRAARWPGGGVSLWAAALLLVAASAAAQTGGVALPDTPAARRLAEVLRLFAAADPAGTRTYVQETLSPGFLADIPLEQHVEIWEEMREDTGGLEVLEVLESRPERIDVAVRAREGGRRLLLVLAVEPDPPHRIEGMGLRQPRPSDAVEAGPVPEGPVADVRVAELLEDYVDRLAAADAFSGVVLLARGDEVLLHEAWGEADKGHAVPNRGDTRFNLGSMNKMFTAIAVAQLVERGTLSWDDPVGKWLGEEWVRPEVGRAVTLRHLVTHTSGLGSYFGPRFTEASRLRFRALEDWAPLVKDEEPRFEPGSDWAYSNTGFLLLGAVVEAAAGQDYFDYIRAHVYGPAGMTATDAYDMDAVVPNMAVPYDRSEGDDGPRYRSTLFEHVIRGGPAGGGLSTAPDLLAFARALHAGRLVRPETLAEMTREHSGGEGPMGGYGYGFILYDEAADTWGHSGGFPGISSVMATSPTTGWTVVVLSNYSGGAQPVERQARALIAAAEAGS